MSFNPENILEKSLIKASEDPAHRPQFYRDLCESDLFIIQHGEEAPAENRRVTLEEGMSVQIKNIEHNGKPYIPVFSSLSRLQTVLTEEVAYLGVNALELMKFTQGAELLLNPGSDYGKEFTAEEVESIVSGSIWKPIETYTQEKEAKVMLGQPQEYPDELVGALTRYFKKEKTVKRAWLSHFFNPDDGHPPHTLIVLDASENYDIVMSEIGIILKNVKVPNPPVDIIPITGNGGLEDRFLKEEKPFYKKKLFGLF